MSMQQDTWWTEHDSHGRGQVDIVHRHWRFLIDSMEHLLLTNNYYIKRKKETITPCPSCPSCPNIVKVHLCLHDH